MRCAGTLFSRVYTRITVLFAAVFLTSPASPEVTQTQLAPGITYTQETTAPPAGPLLINVLRIDPKAPGVRIQAQLGRDVVFTDEPAKGREAVGALAARHGALAAVNAD